MSDLTSTNTSSDNKTDVDVKPEPVKIIGDPEEATSY